MKKTKYKGIFCIDSIIVFILHNRIHPVGTGDGYIP